MEKRLYEIEKRLAYLEKYVDELNSVVIEQNKELEHLRRYTKMLEDKLVSSASPLLEDRPHLEKPPHY